jgi:ferritin-like metal-binding protein YciE
VRLTTLHDVFTEQLGDLKSAEQQLVDALPKMAGAASTPELRDAFEEHWEQTRGHVQRLQSIEQMVGSVPNETCQAMQGLIGEGEEIINADGDPVAKDVALIAAAQRVEHYEMAAYGTARALAKELDYGDAAGLLDDTLDEESTADHKLTKIATGGIMSSGINKAASR